MADKRLRNAVDEALTYPFLTKEVGGYDSSSRSGESGASGHGGGSLTRTAQGAIRDLLGWRYRADDPKGFLAALNKAVNLKEVEGHIEFSWNTARPFMTKADMGEVTGAQAGIYERARLAVEHALPLLDSLKPLRPDADEEGIESVRTIVRTSLTELVTELGNVGGPRIQRVNDYLTRLLGVRDFGTDFFGEQGYIDLVATPEEVDGALGLLRDRFGLQRRLVLNVEDERILTNFLIIVGHTTSIFDIWVAQKPFIERNDNDNKFLGTQLVRLSQLLNVIVESVHETYAAMDSVFFGPEERDVYEISWNGEPRITVAELLEWIEHFASIEAPQLIQDSGKDGVQTVRETLAILMNLVDNAISQARH